MNLSVENKLFSIVGDRNWEFHMSCFNTIFHCIALYTQLKSTLLASLRRLIIHFYRMLNQALIPLNHTAQ